MTKQFQQQTRIAFIGNNSDFIFDCTMYILDFLGKKIDAIKFDQTIQISNQDFVLIALDKYDNNTNKIEPTIAVVTDYEENYNQFVQSITAGGILIYNPENKALCETIEKSEKYCRKLPFYSPNYQIIDNSTFLETDLGTLQINIPEEKINLVEATRLLCQQLGIQEEEFYEALINFKICK